jgi:ribosomal protein S18 acetylase RimI-like enzyme
MVQLRVATARDLRAVVQVHARAFPGFLMTLLGPGFLRIYYETLLRHEGSIFIVASSGSGIAGFAAGFVDPGSFYRAFRRRRFLALIAAIPHCIVRPGIWPRLLESAGQANARSRNQCRTDAELASIAVVPGLEGGGLGRRLLEAFVGAATERGANNVRLTTDAAGNDRVNRFYEQAGFTRTGTAFRGKARTMNEYVFPIDGGRHE